VEEYTREGIAENLATRLIGRHIRWHDTLPSTNDLAKRLAEIQVPEGTVIVAEEQTAGRGRLGRPWAAPRGASGPIFRSRGSRWSVWPHRWPRPVRSG